MVNFTLNYGFTLTWADDDGATGIGASFWFRFWEITKNGIIKLRFFILVKINPSRDIQTQKRPLLWG